MSTLCVSFGMEAEDSVFCTSKALIMPRSAYLHWLERNWTVVKLRLKWRSMIDRHAGDLETMKVEKKLMVRQLMPLMTGRELSERDDWRQGGSSAKPRSHVFCFLLRDHQAATGAKAPGP